MYKNTESNSLLERESRKNNKLFSRAKTVVIASSLLLATACNCDTTPKTPEWMREAHKKAQKEKCNTQHDIEKTKNKIYKLQTKLQELEMKEKVASEKERVMLQQAQEASSLYKPADCPTCN